ncbi:hypothetical protein JB92DRAFT_2838659 [Gautieria morchelliformis]|nr:hypothetical protein JB92DRAFT_2838659 [Gautieria morchelliformis]
MWDNLQTAGGGVRKFFVHLNMTVGRGRERDGDREWGEGERVCGRELEADHGDFYGGVRKGSGAEGGGRGSYVELRRKSEAAPYMPSPCPRPSPPAHTALRLRARRRTAAIPHRAHLRAAHSGDHDDPGHTRAALWGGDNTRVHTSAGELFQSGSTQVQVQLEGDGAAEGATGAVDVSHVSSSSAAAPYLTPSRGRPTPPLLVRTAGASPRIRIAHVTFTCSCRIPHVASTEKCRPAGCHVKAAPTAYAARVGASLVDNRRLFSHRNSRVPAAPICIKFPIAVQPGRAMCGSQCCSEVESSSTSAMTPRPPEPLAPGDGSEKWRPPLLPQRSTIESLPGGLVLHGPAHREQPTGVAFNPLEIQDVFWPGSWVVAQLTPTLWGITGQEGGSSRHTKTYQLVVNCVQLALKPVVETEGDQLQGSSLSIWKHPCDDDGERDESPPLVPAPKCMLLGPGTLASPVASSSKMSSFKKKVRNFLLLLATGGVPGPNNVHFGAGTSGGLSSRSPSSSRGCFQIDNELP